MELLSKAVEGYMAHSSMIRRMFEAGIELRKKYGNDKVYDFSLGNPDLPAPKAVVKGLQDFAAKCDQPFAFGYTPNAGAPWAREALAKWVSKEQGVQIDGNGLIISVGAASALNAVLRAIFNPGEELITFAPYFVEYDFYVANHGGYLTRVNTKKDTWEPDVNALEAAISKKTRAVIINSPNNPTGAIYSLDTLKDIVSVLEKKSREVGHPIWLLSDEPYRFLAYDGAVVPSVLPLYPYAVLLSSFSKNMSLPGERPCRPRSLTAATSSSRPSRSPTAYSAMSTHPSSASISWSPASAALWTAIFICAAATPWPRSSPKPDTSSPCPAAPSTSSPRPPAGMIRPSSPS